MKKIIGFTRAHPAATLASIAMFVLYILIGRLSGLAPGDWGTWTGGIGTVGTLIGTIWLSTAQSRKESRAETTLARLHAVGLIVRLQVVAHTLDLACMELEFVSAENYNGNRLENAKAQIATIVVWSLEELIPLAPLPDFIAAKLASARARITSFPAFAESVMRMSGLQTPEQRFQYANELLKEIRITKTLVESAQSGCIDAARKFQIEP